MFRPVNKYILVKKEEFQDKTEDGLILTTKTVKAPNRGVVLARSKNCVEEFKIGDVILFNPFAGFEIPEGLVIEEGEMLGVEDGV